MNIVKENNTYLINMCVQYDYFLNIIANNNNNNL